MFPLIKHINDVLPWIKDKPEFIIAQKEQFDVINYVVSSDTTFDSPMARECRGLKFDKKGYIIARPFHKFFNINQVAETQANVLVPKFEGPHLIMPKMDGSMIHPIMLNCSVRLCTKMGITDVAMQAEQFIFGKTNYEDLILYFLKFDMTPLFEWTSRKQQIVLDYETDNLTLLAVRNNYTGVYLKHDTIVALGKEFKIPVVACYDAFRSVHDLVREAKNLEGAEGFVVQFPDGDMVKAKSDWYCLRHNSRDLVQREFKIVQAVLNEEIDDLKPMLIDTDLDRVNEMEQVVEGLIEWGSICFDEYFKYIQKFPSRKDFATSEYCAQLSGVNKQAMFKMLDGQTSRECAIEVLKRNSAKECLWEEFKVTNKNAFLFQNKMDWTQHDL